MTGNLASAARQVCGEGAASSRSSRVFLRAWSYRLRAQAGGLSRGPAIRYLSSLLDSRVYAVKGSRRKEATKRCILHLLWGWAYGLINTPPAH